MTPNSDPSAPPDSGRLFATSENGRTKTVTACPCHALPVRWSDIRSALVHSQALCVFLLVYTASYAMRLFITQDLLLTKTCVYYFDLDATLCANVSNWTETRDAVEQVANNYCLFSILVQLTPAAVLSIFLAPWCDKFGHRIPIVVATLGGICQDLGTIYTVINMAAPLYVSVLCCVPNGFSGGLVCVLTAVCSNASLSTQGPLRTIHFLIVLMSAMIGMASGQLVAGHIFQSGGYLPVFVVSAAMLTACLVWACLVIKNPPVQRSTCKAMCQDLLQVRNFVNGILVVGRKRHHNGRAQILLLMSSMCTILFILEGARGINYFYAKKMYGWGVSRFSDINSSFLFLRMIGVFLFVVLAKLVLRLSDCTIALVGCGCGIMQNVCMAVATDEVLFYLSYVLGTLDALAPVGIKSHASRLLDRDETSLLGVDRGGSPGTYRRLRVRIPGVQRQYQLLSRHALRHLRPLRALPVRFRPVLLVYAQGKALHVSRPPRPWPRGDQGDDHRIGVHRCECASLGVPSLAQSQTVKSRYRVYMHIDDYKVQRIIFFPLWRLRLQQPFPWPGTFELELQRHVFLSR